MLSIKVKNATYQVVGYNVHEGQEKDSFQLWVIRPGEKGLLVKSGSKEEVEELKSALDFAVEHDVKLFEIF